MTSPRERLRRLLSSSFATQSFKRVVYFLVPFVVFAGIGAWHVLPEARSPDEAGLRLDLVGGDLRFKYGCPGGIVGSKGASSYPALEWAPPLAVHADASDPARPRIDFRSLKPDRQHTWRRFLDPGRLLRFGAGLFASFEAKLAYAAGEGRRLGERAGPETIRSLEALCEKLWLDPAVADRERWRPLAEALLETESARAHFLDDRGRTHPLDDTAIWERIAEHDWTGHASSPPPARRVAPDREPLSDTKRFDLDASEDPASGDPAVMRAGRLQSSARALARRLAVPPELGVGDRLVERLRRLALAEAALRDAGGSVPDVQLADGARLCGFEPSPYGTMSCRWPGATSGRHQAPPGDVGPSP